jgi:hypothetical protein
MTRPERQQTVLDILKDFRGPEPLKQLFWSELNYSRVNTPLSRQKWNAMAAESLAADPVLFAIGGDGFHIIHSRLPTDKLLMGQERPVVSQLLKEHPYALFIFSNKSLNRWHFLNVKYDDEVTKRRVFRRITVGPEERLRTASERIALLDLESVGADLFGLSPLAIQRRHDEAFDVEPVTREFFKEYARVFEEVEKRIEGINDKERRRLYTQRLFNRLMFIAFIQKKGWLKFGRNGDYLCDLWLDFKRSGKSNRNFYRDRLKLLFFQGLNTPNEVNLIGINRGGFLKELIGQVPYLNGGLFEEDDDDRDSKIVVPDECIEAIIEELFSRFNFTVTESTPLDIEVAVDPEMLGKIFEELVTGRHETGSYYTPKPVVSFMCREALKGYLGSQLPSEAPESIERFVEEHHPEGLKNPEPVLEALRKVRLCDPACGSGAYLLGMLHELIDLRACLFATSKLDAISTFDRKLQIIQNNLYGVDLDPFAVNIARLRLWLSLAVEYEGDTPPPLPNLDFKIEAGDSLTVAAPSLGLEQGFRKSLLDEYLKLRAEFLTAHHSHKIELRKRIAEIRKTIHGWAHAGSAVDGFDWAVEFTEVFTDGGFDIVLANPPYVRQELIKELKPHLKEVYPDVYMGTADLYCYFYARALQLLRSSGMLVFISSNKWFRANYGARLREHIAKSCAIRSITDFGELPVFQTVATFPMIFSAQKDSKNKASPLFTQVKSLEPPYPDVLAIIRDQGQRLPPQSVAGPAWTLGEPSAIARIKKMDAAGVPIIKYLDGRICRGVITGLNQAFVIDGTERAKLISLDSKSGEIIKPLAVGDDIRKWRIEKNDRWLIVTPVGINIKRYPAVFAHLKEWQAELEKRWDKGNHWWELRPCDYYSEFDAQKIAFPDIAKESRFALASRGLYFTNTTYFLPCADLYLLGVLNSSAIWDYAKQQLTVLGDAEKGGRLRFFTQFVEKLPVPSATAAKGSAIAALVQKCLDAKGVGCENWEAEINERVAALYGL